MKGVLILVLATVAVLAAACLMDYGQFHVEHDAGTDAGDAAPDGRR